MRVSPARLASWLGFGVVLGVACTGPSATTTDGVDTTTDSDGCPIGSAGCPCTPGGTCDGSLVCASKVCVSPDDTTSGTGTTTGDETTSSATTTTTNAGECTPADEHENEGCPPAEPYCNSKGECVACTGISSCAVADPTRPACDAGSGLCVECTAQDASGCAGATPVCDGEAMTCRACTEHAECTGSACDIATGACFPVEHALWVDAAGGCDDDGAGSEAAPLCTISAALARVSADKPRAILVRGATYSDPLAVPANSLVAILRVGATAVAIAGPGSESLRVDAGARVYLDGLEVSGNTQGSGIGCTGAEVWVDHTLIRQQAQSGLAAENCTLRLRAAVLTKNIGEGLFLAGGEARLENVFVTDNGDKNIADNPRGGLALAGGAAAELVYTTLYGNSAFIGGGYSIDCDPDAGEESLTIRNSIAFNFTGYSTFNCEGAEEVTHSAISAASDDPNDDNTGVTTVENSMLMAPDPKLPGVYRPKKDTKLVEVGVHAVGDPDRDFEGDPRPTDGPGFPGADHPL